MLENKIVILPLQYFVYQHSQRFTWFVLFIAFKFHISDTLSVPLGYIV